MKINYQESTKTIRRNPEMGYPNFSSWQDMKKEGILISSHVSEKMREAIENLHGYVNLLYTLTDFTKNGGGEDIPITEKALSDLGDQLHGLAQRGGCALLRFAYDSRGERDKEPESLDMILTHIKQIGEVLHKYNYAVAGLEAGIIGLFGEMHTSNYCGAEFSKPIIQALLDACPDGKPVLLRSPAYLKAWSGKEFSEIAGWTPEKGSDAARLGFYNDGYMGSDSDLGTWLEDTMTRKEGIDYLNRMGTQVFYGGEYSGAWWWTTRFHTWLPENAIPEMYRSHVDYIRGNVFKDEHVSYENFTYGEDYEYSWFPDNSAYYGETAWKFIRDHIGYRFVLRASDAKAEGRNVTLSGKVENTGFSSVINLKKAVLIFKGEDGSLYQTPIDLDVRTWLSCQTTPYAFSATLPEEAAPGRYEVYLRISLFGITEEACRLSAIEFANEDIFNEDIGGNLIGEVNIQ